MTIWQGNPVTSSIWKSPLRGRVLVRGVNVTGDDQADREVHGGPEKSLYAYDDEDYAWWSAELGRTLEPGTFGENLTVAGIAVSDALIGEQWRIGSVVLQVTQPRFPCYKLAMRMNDPNFVRTFSHAGRPGAYLHIISDGELGANDVIAVVQRPNHTLTIKEMFRIYLFEHQRASEFLAAPELSDRWQAWARQQISPS